MVNEESLRVAVAGCHRMLLRDLTHHNFAAAFNAVPETEIVGVFDYGEETRSDFVTCWQDVWGDIPTFGEYERMLEVVKPDLVCIATRQTMHAEQIEAGVAAGVRGILCDKPLATSLAEMDRILAACADVPLAFGLDRRWSKPYLYLREVMSDRIGPILSIVAYGLPNTINHGCHLYDAMLGLIGDPEPVWVSGLIDDSDSENPRRKMDPPSRAQVGFDNELIAYITTDGGKGHSFEVVGEKGRLSIRTDGREAYFGDGDGGHMEPLEIPSVEGRWPEGPEAVRDLCDGCPRRPTDCMRH